MLDRANGLVDGETFQPLRFDLKALCDSYSAHRLWTASSSKFAYDGSVALPGDLERIVDAQVVGIIERDEPDFSELVPANSTFSLTKADFSSGDWVFVMANRDGELRKVAFK